MAVTQSSSAVRTTAPDVALDRGLTSTEARARLARFGPNTTPGESASVWRRALAKLWSPVPWMLEAAVLFELLLRDYLQAGVVAFLLGFNAALGFFQESRAQATLAALKSRLALDAVVRRDGNWVTLPASELVPGDVIKLALGTIVGADARIYAGEVSLDHSTLTGESMPVDGAPGVATFAGALVRWGEAIATVTATGARTAFGRTAELVRLAHAESSEERAVLRVVRNLMFFDGAVIATQVTYALFLGLSWLEIVPLVLTSLLAAIPVALPATFTLASTLGARALAAQGVLPTRLSAVDEAATMDVLCSDKTGTLTRNELAVSATVAFGGHDPTYVLGLAALASSDDDRDLVDAAVRAAAQSLSAAPLRRVGFTPFDPTTKTAEATAVDAAGCETNIVKGAYARVAARASTATEAGAATDRLEARGLRVLGVAAGPPSALQMVGVIGLSDPPRTESRDLVEELRGLGVRVVMVTGDAPVTARVVADAVGLGGGICPPMHRFDALHPEDFGVYAGVLPEDKYAIVRAFQQGGHTVGMCGDGANDAPALRQAQMGIAVASATDVAKSAAGIVLTEPGLGGIVAATREGRVVFQRILTYVSRSLTVKIQQMLFLTGGLVLLGHAILTPLLMVLVMTVSDFLMMSATTDHVRPSRRPNVWRINNLTIVSITLGLATLAFSIGVIAVGKYALGMDLAALQTLAAVVIVFSGQAVFFVVRERRHVWSSRPSTWVLGTAAANVAIFSAMAIYGTLMAPLPPAVVLGVLLASVVLALLLDVLRAAADRRLATT